MIDTFRDYLVITSDKGRCRMTVSIFVANIIGKSLDILNLAQSLLYLF